MPHKPGIGAIFGVTAEDGVAAQKRVVLMDRSNLTVVRRTTGDVDGAYVFNGLNADTDDYLIFGVDDDGSPTKEALIRDKITPVPAHQGATFLGNWHILAQRKRPIAGFAGDYSYGQTPQPRLPYASRKGWVDVSTGADGPTDVFSSLTPGAPQKGHVWLGGGKRHYYPRYGTYNIAGIYQNPATVAGEVVAELKTDWEIVLWNSRASGGPLSSGDFAAYVAGIKYAHSTKTLSIILGIFDYSDPTFANSKATRLTYNVSALSEMVAHHFMFDAVFADRVKLWVNGALQVTQSITGTNSTVYSSSLYTLNKGCSVLGAANANNPLLCQASNARIAVGMFYDAPITDADATVHYNALMVGSTPIVTGYAREIITYAPELYFRMNDPDATNGIRSDYLMDNVTYDRPFMIGAASATFGVATPVIGGAGIRFQSGVGVRSNYVGGGTSNPYEFSICALIKPEVATPSAIETILTLTDSGETIFAGLLRNTSGQLYLQYRAGSTNITHVFTGTTLSTSAFSFVVATLDKVAQTAKLYINGSLVETLSIPVTILDQDTATAQNDLRSQLFIGGFVNDANVPSLPFTGVISEVAFYTTVLTASQIGAQYAAAGVL